MHKGTHAHITNVCMFKQEGGKEEEVCQRQCKLLARLPEFCVKDMASWFGFVARFRPVLLQGLQVVHYCIISRAMA